MLCSILSAAAEPQSKRPNNSDGDGFGIDLTYIAIDLIKQRLADNFSGVDYSIVGEPTTVEEAAELAALDPFQFQLWACGLVGARGLRERRAKKGADRGIDGELTFVDGRETEVRRVLISVKAGKVKSTQVRELRGTVERERADFGLFLSLEQPTEPMKREAVEAGFFEWSSGKSTKFPRLQLLTVGQLLSGQRPRLPWSDESRPVRATRATDEHQARLRAG